MIVLDNAGTRALSLINTQNGANVEVCFSDYTTSSAAYSRGVPTLTTISSATTTSICATPASGTIRDIDYVNIYNTYAGSQNFTVQITSGSGGPFILVFATLLQNESLNYTHGSGWCALDANGNRKEATSSTFATLTVTGNATIGGTLEVTGVATFTAQPILSSLTASRAVFTDGSKGLVSNTITGSGDVVMSTSPTFATSVIGSATMAVFNSVSTTVNAFGAATTLNIGNSGGTNTVLGATTFSQAVTSTTNGVSFNVNTGSTGTNAIYQATNGTQTVRLAIAASDDAYVGTTSNHPLSVLVNGSPVGQFTTTGINSMPIGQTTPAALAATTINTTAAAASTTASQLQLGSTTQSTIGANGAASALTANPLGYLIAYLGSTKIVIPYYNA